MNKIIEFYKTHKHAIIWTIGYGVVMYLILNLLFGFDMLSGRHWSILMRAHLRGFAGFVFGILVLAAIPLYAATMMFIIRKKEPILRIFPTKKKEEKKEDVGANVNSPESEPAELTLPENLPPQLRAAFLRAKNNMPATPVAPNIKKSEPQPETAKSDYGVPQSESINPKSEIPLPLPDDFDFAAPTESGPMFKEISFGDEPSVTPNHDIIFKNGFAIATHDDADFWIADETTWFASGKTKKSPVAAAIAAANDANAKPALLLLATNIQDLADKIQEWESMGIKIIKDINEI